jgi:Ca-activated chloride channel homolog
LVDIVKGLEVPKPIRDRQGRIINEKTLNEELATAIGDGVALGVDRLRESDSTSKVLILLTDGDNNAGSVDPREAADIAKELGIKIHTIGIGRNDVVPIPQEDEFGRRILVQARFRIDEGLLKDIAEKTGGDYFHASDAEGLARVYSRIDVMEKSKFEELKYAQYSELYRWFAGIGITVVVVIGILFETRFRSLP